MSRRTSTINITGDYEESIVQFARHLGTEQVRRKVFLDIYGRGSKPKSKKQIMQSAEIAESKSQQVTNALDHLSKHHLINKADNNGSVKDGSRLVYSKIEEVRANKSKIIKFADDAKKRESIPTKRRPATTKKYPSPFTLDKRELQKKKKLNVLYLTSSPSASNPLRVDGEVRLVQEAIRASKFRDNVTVEYKPAADLDSLVSGLNDVRPQVVHFSGHGSVDGILGDDGGANFSSGTEIDYELLANALEATDSPPQVVVLNSCHGSAGKSKLLNVVKLVVSMRDSVSDIAAAAFSQKFYAGLASGQSVEAAFKQGLVGIKAISISETHIPEINAQSGVDQKKLVLV